MQTVEATIDEHGTVRLREAVALPFPRRALVTILEEEPQAVPHETALPHEPLPGVVPSPLTPQEQADAFRRWAADPPTASGPHPETTFRREDIYDDEGR